uniref:SHSP domain-containing protein n=1 Tax=Glossina austeni TaxID=7395 RepID=A0A1A9VRD0_GLOAU
MASCIPLNQSNTFTSNVVQLKQQQAGQQASFDFIHKSVPHMINGIFMFNTLNNNKIATNASRPKQNYISDINSPLIQEDGDNKVLKLRFDVSQYAPEEIVVKTVDQKLLVHAKHEEKSDTKSVYREYNREFLLPKGVNPETIRSSLSKDGVLTVDAPLPAITSGETMIPITHK